ncbi:MAG: hypothetical protein ABWZ52_03665, partial [Acidimicrobiales bacterium]
KVVGLLANNSTKTYTTESVSMWKILFGEDTWDTAKLTKSATKIWGQAAADATNAAMMLQKLAALAASDEGGSS